MTFQVVLGPITEPRSAFIDGSRMIGDNPTGVEGSALLYNDHLLRETMELIII